MDTASAPQTPAREVIATDNIKRWIEPWYGAYAILGALASGLAVIAIPLVVTDGGGGATEIGTAIAAQNIGALFAPVWGTIADRTKAYRAIFFLGFILIGLGFLALSAFGGLAAWAGGAFLIGFGTGASNTVASLFVVEFTPPAEWGPRISWMQTFNAAGSVLGMALAGLLAPRLDTLLAALLVIPAIVHLLHRSGPNAASVVAAVHRPRMGELLNTLRTAMRTGFGLFLAAWFLFSLAVSSFASLYPVLMAKSYGIEVAQSALLMSIATALSIPLYNYAGRLVTRRGPAFTLGIGIGGRMLGLAGLGAVAFMHVGWAMLPVILLFGLYQGIWPLLSVAANDLAAGLAPFGEGAAMGLFNAAAAIASAAGAIAGGAVADRFGYGAVSLFAATVALLALAFVLPLSRGRGGSP
jgi:MFS family permease